MLAVALAAPLGCANLGPHVWVDEYQDPMPPPESGAYVLAPGDVIQVRVFLQEGMSARARVRSDGKISLPFLNDVQAAGYEPAVLAQQLAVRLKDFVNNPVVTISVEEPRQLEILVVGEVQRQGAVMLSPGAGVLQALVAAGGITEFGHQDRIFVVRQRVGDSPKGVRVRFSYPDLLRGGGRAAAFRLRSGDQVVVD
jgi:polysaccharide export outer membrane protein